MNSIEYRVSNPLTITVDLGVLHSPSALISRSDSGISPTVVPGFRLHYQPSENMFFQIDFRSYPQGYYWGRGSHINDFGGSVEFRGR
ncbi:MAG: hypothetical protein GF315_02370 [candidate division Zixibacteria bacterium]|nr:hypothetical protein [candidate division Zixibacteria bacterium]